MKIMEVAPDFVQNQASTLMTILQYLESKTKPGTKIPMDNVSRLMNNAGYTFSYANIEELMQVFPPLAQIITDFNADSITIGEESVADKEQFDPTGKKKEQQSATVDKMAKSASKF